VAVSPALEEITLQRFDLVPAASDRLLMVFNLDSGVIRTIYVRITIALTREQVDEAQRVLNERLGGLTLREIRNTIGERLRDVTTTVDAGQLLDIIVAEGEGLFAAESRESMLLGSTSVLIDQPEFASSEQMRTLVTLTDRRDVLRDALAQRRREGLTVTIGGENDDAGLAGFTLVTSTYHRGGATGLIGVLGPTRMPYDKIIGLVEHTGRLVEGLLQ
jgi:heat-inducible transcriptional repressor